MATRTFQFFSAFTILPRPSPPVFGRVAVELEGRVYGSWISGRGPSVGAVITEPYYMIEDILRNILNVPSARIDTASFDSNEGFNGTLFINSDYTIDALELCDWLAAQGAGFIARANGIYRFVNLGVVTPSADFVIRWDEVVDVPWLSRTSVNEIVNRLTIQHGFLPQYGSFSRQTLVENSASQTANGVREGEIQCPSLDKTSVAALATLLVGSSTGIWSKTHKRVTLRLGGFQRADKQPGDIFNLDAASFDPHILPPGLTSWGTGAQAVDFITEKVELTVDGVLISGISIGDIN